MSATHPGRRLKELDLAPRKGLGQHFLTDRGALGKIIRAADLNQNDVVVEVGPGLGVLTAELIKQTRGVIAVELDEGLARQLKKDLAEAGNLTIIQGDILEIAPESLLAGIPGGYKIVANLPYYITSAVLRHFLESNRRPDLLVVMVQREVAHAITAPPGDLGLLGLSVQIFGTPRIVARVAAGSFHPPPKVESAVVKIDVFSSPVIPEAELPGFFGVARAAFSAPRKQIQNSLAQGLEADKTDINTRLQAANIDPKRRAETLQIPEWVKLWEVFKP